MVPSGNRASSEIQRAEHLWRCTRALLSEGGQATIQPDEWDDLISLLEANQLDGYLFDRLTSHKTLDENQRAYLRKRIQEENALQMIADLLMNEVLQTLAFADITCMPIKAALFRHFLYKTPQFRSAIDLDFCVQEQDFEKAHGLLSDRGYARVDGEANRPVTMHEVYERGYRPPADRPQILVEIHKNLTKETRYPFDYASLWQRSFSLSDFRKRIGVLKEPCDYPETDHIRFMSPEDALVHQFLHNANHCFELPARWLTDLALIINQWNPNWNEVHRLVTHSKLKTAAYFSLSRSTFLVEPEKLETMNKFLKAIAPPRVRKKYLNCFISTQGTVSKDPSSPGSIRFVRNLWGLRSQQLLVGLPLVDGLVQPTRFVLDYLLLRAKDLYSDTISSRKNESIRS